MAGERGAYSDLRRAIVEAGLLERAYGYYCWRAGLSFLILFSGVALALVGPASPLTTGVGVCLIAFGSVQVALIGHDAGHLAMLGGRAANRAVGELCWSLAVGISFAYWSDRHTRHHASTNDVSADPDLQFQLGPFFAPLLPFAFRLEGWRFALRDLSGTERVGEVTLLAISAAVWLAPAVTRGGEWLLVYVLGQVLAGVYLSLLIAPNHLGMATWEPGTQPGFLERQLLSSRNVAPSPLWDFVFGGLNYQIEHHLFPTMPRNSFGAARRMVRAFCSARGVPYTEIPALECAQLILSELRHARSTATSLA